MKYLRWFLLSLSILVAVAGIIYVGWLLYPKFRSETESPVKAIPENAALIIKINDPESLWKTIRKENIIWKQLQMIPAIGEFRDQIQTLDSLIGKDQKIRRLMDEKPFYFAVLTNGRTTLGSMFLTNVKGYDAESEIISFIQKTYGNKVTLLKTQYGSSNLIRVILKTRKEPFFFAVRKNVFICSSHPELVNKALDRLSLNISSLATTGFQRVEAVTGKKVDANLYVNYRLISPFLMKVFQEDERSEIESLSHFADWSGWDIMLKSDEILVTGFTTFSDTANQYLPLFRKQVPQRTPALLLLPDNTASISFLGVSNPGAYQSNLMAFFAGNHPFPDVYSYPLASLEEQYEIRVKDYFIPWMKGEIYSFSTTKDEVSSTLDYYALFGITDSISADTSLIHLGELTSSRHDSVYFNGHTIHSIHLTGILPGLFGKTFSHMENVCYFFWKNYIVFGNDINSLKKYIQQVGSGNILGNNKEFSDFNENLPESANLIYYFDLRLSLQRLTGLFRDDINLQLSPVIDSLKKFERVAIQFTNRGDLIYTSMILHYNPFPGERGPLKWQVILDTTLTRSPVFTELTPKGDVGILALDKFSRLYMIDTSGNIRWRLQIPGAPMGEIHPVYFGRSDSISFLFNTPDWICLVNPDGKFAPGYPVKTEQKAMAPLSVIQIPRSHEYQVLVPLNDKRVYSFSLSSRRINSWSYLAMREDIVQPVDYVRYGRKDFFFIKSKEGHLMITDRQGKTSVKTNNNLVISSRAGFYLNRTNKKGAFLTSDPTGKIIYIGESGRTSEATFNIFTGTHRFFYEDLSGDGSYEYIFYDRNKIYFYNRFYQLIYSYVFQRELTVEPYLIDLPDGKKYVGAVSAFSNEVFLFNDKGKIELPNGIHGNCAFDLGSWKKSDYQYLITGSGKILKCYRLSKQ
ncbi:MAG: DUF3352 domain-containing protein [Bacteroidota bacterium]|nr:DUF3352 domain-containing protein [Bacteroidota bacterium]